MKAYAAAIVLGTAGVACLQAPERPPLTEAVGLVPDRLVEAEEPIQVLFSGAVVAEAPEMVFQVVDRDDVSIAVTQQAEPTAWRLVPTRGWPAGEVLRVLMEGSLLDSEGRAVGWPEGGFVFEVAPVLFRPRAAVRWPTPGRSAPAGLRWVGLEGVAETTEVRLRADDRLVVARRAEAVDGVVRFALDDTLECRGLCPGAEYRLESDDLGVVDGPRGGIVTSTVADQIPPRFTIAEVEVRPGVLEVRWACDEPVRVDARLVGADLSFSDTVGLGRAGVWRFAQALLPGETYGLLVTAEDLSGGLTTGVDQRVVGPAPVQVLLRELVFSPRSDWGDSDPRGEPFDESPGRGTVSSADEWVELVNVSDRLVDIEAVGLRVVALDGSPAETQVSSAPAVRFGDGGQLSGWLPGEALVVRPRGDMAQSSLTVEVWAGALLLDRVVVGSDGEADHPGGAPPDLEREALARTADGRWRWCRPTPGDPRPNSDC